MSSRSFFLAYSRWGLVSTLMGIAHLVFVATLFFGFHAMSVALWIPLALVYSISIAWSINSTSHNFIHNAFFTSAVLNRIYSVILSVTNGFSREFYRHVRLRHHVGNTDRIGANGTTDKVYNWTWLYNGFHVEHYFRPKGHWMKMVELRDSIVEEQRAAGVHVMLYSHGVGFLDRTPPRHTTLGRGQIASA